MAGFLIRIGSQQNFKTVYFQRIFFLVFCVGLSTHLAGQDNTVFRSIKGVLYKVHTVAPGETVYQLSNTYHISAKEIEKHNPLVKEGLKVGQEILIPTSESAESVESVENTEKSQQETSTNHIVEKGETLFSISKKYNVPPDDIKKWNNLQSNVISIGQTLVIKKIETTNTSSQKENEVSSQKEELYEVKKGETLYALSRKFNVPVDDIINWNKLDDLSLKEGQKLRIKYPEKGEPKENVVNKETIQENNQDKIAKTKEIPLENPDSRGESKDVKENVVKDPIPTKKVENDSDIKIKPSSDQEVDEFVEVVERGVAELIPNTSDVRKYLALHRTAKVGTIIRVRNEMNDREIWARVINKLPDTGDNKNVLVKISQAAYDQLGALDKKFRVVVTYIP